MDPSVKINLWMEENRAANQESEFKDLVDDIRLSMFATNLKDPPPTDQCCIYRVPSKIREVNEKAYTPRVVSIGPFHNGDSKLKAMENIKLRYLKGFLDRTRFELKDFIGFLKKKEGEVRSCYAEAIQQSSDSFVKIILVDACFILELFLRRRESEALSTVDPIFSKPWLQSDIARDLLLLENQLPFFVLKDLYNVTSGLLLNRNMQNSLIELTLEYFEGYNQQKKRPRNFKHFTDLLRTFNLPNNKAPRSNFPSKFSLPSASDLNEAGLQFKAIRKEKECFLNLKYANGVLEIPHFEVDDYTETLFRNVLAFEQCHYPFDTDICDYFFLLDWLINTTKDVDILVKEKILINWLGDNEALATLVNSSGINLVYSNFNSDFLRLCRDLNEFCNEKWHRRKAILRREYLSTPWKTASSGAAILLLFLTLIQTVCSVIALF